MDISIFNNLEALGILAPLIFGLYLFVLRFRLSFVNKKILNWGSSLINLISLAIFLFIYFQIKNNIITSCNLEFLSIEKFSLNFGFEIDKENILFLIFTSFLAFIISIYSKFYFDKKKQFIFTKQRFYIFLNILSSLSYAFLASINLFQGIFTLIIQSAIILIFSYFDIFKTPANFNITRFHTISHIGNISLLMGCLILFKYSILSQGYISSNSLKYDELNLLISYMYGISSSVEFKLMALSFLIGIMTRLVVFPFSCYYSFFANSSNIFYLSTISLANNILGIFLFLKFIPLLELSNHYLLYFEFFLGFAVLISLIQILFERNIKIIFGYLTSIMNPIFIILFLNFNLKYILLSYFALNLAFILILMILFFKDKTNFKRRIINKQLGFILEKSYIVAFEVMPSKISKLFEIIDEKIIQNAFVPFIKLFDYLCTIFVKKTSKKNIVKSIRSILIIFAIIALVAIFIALFGGFRC